MKSGHLQRWMNLESILQSEVNQKEKNNASGEGERVIALESREGNLASRRVEECL